MMVHGKLVTVILPVFNGEAYVGDAIQSVINQTHDQWELIVINDGSKDRTAEIVSSFSDSRIRYFEQPNSGVSVSRNVGLKNMKGDFFCFLDADDILPLNSLKARFDLFAENEKIEFADGRVDIENMNDGTILRTYLPSYAGPPFEKLIRISTTCFCGLTWMIRRTAGRDYTMNKQLTHCEDLLFFMELSKSGGLFRYTGECILRYRRRPDSAMSDLSGLDNGYHYIYKSMKSWPQVAVTERMIYWLKTRKIMFLSYLFDMKSPWRAILSLTKF